MEQRIHRKLDASIVVNALFGIVVEVVPLRGFIYPAVGDDES